MSSLVTSLVTSPLQWYESDRHQDEDVSGLVREKLVFIGTYSKTTALVSAFTKSENRRPGAVGRGLQSEDAVVGFARSCGSVCNKQPLHTQQPQEPASPIEGEDDGDRHAVEARKQG